MAGACPNCTGALGVVPCVHGSETARACRALADLSDARSAARRDQLTGPLPVPGQEGGEAFERAGRRHGVSGTTVRRLHRIMGAGDTTLIADVRAGKLAIKPAFMRIVKPGSIDDPNTALSPDSIVDPARREAGGRFDLDPATITRNPINARCWYALERGDDGLESSWHVDGAGRHVRTIWINPPYSNIMPWLVKAHNTVLMHPDVAIWMLIPASTDTAYGQFALRNGSAACFVNERVRHLRADDTRQGSPEFGSMVVGFGAATLAHYHEIGIVMRNSDIAKAAA